MTKLVGGSNSMFSFGFSAFSTFGFGAASTFFFSSFFGTTRTGLIALAQN
jgi:hypothetical protein